MSTNQVSRRALLRGVPAVAGTAFGLSLISACGSGDDGGSGTGGGPTADVGSGRDAVLPTFKAFEGADPDMPGDGFAVPEGFRTYPTGLSDAITDTIGDGSTVTIACGMDAAAPPVMARNTFWQSLNERVNATLDFQMVPDPDYGAKFATLIAGGDIPDVIQVPARHPDTPEIAEALFEDLTAYVGGDAVLDYPFLANLPSATWTQSIYHGKVYGVRYPLHMFGSFMFARRDVLTDLGLSVDDVTDGESFADLCRAITDPSKNRWALANPVALTWFAMEMLGKAFNPGNLEWHEDGGKLTQGWESDEYRQSLEWVKGLWDEGLFHPDALAMGGSDAIAQFKAGTVPLDFRGGNQWETRVADDGLDVTAIPPVAFDGGGLGQKALTKGVYSMASVRKGTEPERVQMILRIMNFLAAPFGTKEYLRRNYGIEGEHYTMVENNPERTETGTAEATLPTKYVAQPPPWVYIAGHPDAAEEYHAFISEVCENSLQDPTTGLWSNKDFEVRGDINNAVADTIGGIFRGDRTLEDFDAAMDTWRADGGDAVRAEYEAALSDAS